MFIRWILAESSFSALSLAFWRELVTFSCLFVGLVLLRPNWLRISRRDLPWFVVLGSFSVGTFHVLWNVAVVEVGYAAATILLYSAPVFVSLMAWLIWREPLTRVKIMAIAMAIGGCILVAGTEGLTTFQVTAGGLVLGVALAIAYGSFSILGRQLAPRYPPWTVLTYGFAFGAVTLLPFQLAITPPQEVPGVTWFWFAALVFLATILPFGAYLSSLRWLPVSVASIMAASEVVFGSMLAYLFFGERLQAGQILGAVLVVGGVTLIVWKEPARSP